MMDPLGHNAGTLGEEYAELAKEHKALLRVAKAGKKVCERLNDVPMNGGDAAAVFDLGEALKELPEGLLEVVR